VRFVEGGRRCCPVRQHIKITETSRQLPRISVFSLASSRHPESGGKPRTISDRFGGLKNSLRPFAACRPLRYKNSTNPDPSSNLATAFTTNISSTIKKTSNHHGNLHNVDQCQAVSRHHRLRIQESSHPVGGVTDGREWCHDNWRSQSPPRQQETSCPWRHYTLSCTM
jgi:hypothetical protein